MKTLIALAAGLVVASSLPVFGQSITWNLGGSSNVTSTGGTKSFTVNGVKVTASAWSYTKGSNNNALEASKLGQWSPGLGVINNEENGSSPWHQVDNEGQNDFILFTFDTLVDVESVKIQASPGPYDQDVSYWVGNTNSSNLNGVTYSGLSALGFLGEQQENGNSTSNAKNVSINSPSSGVNAILFGPKTGLVSDSRYIDAFKINSITASVVPEPSTALLSVLGVLGICARRRR
ncbi:PEP-CTERM sorting domain-containing protein [Luteolibacter algae]|uniref:PEP-CTERM sorting domain-containing protein n=1 Tax=Luteolibacter algae TaxID=454151 RepID=A0ABW5D5F8_9BACT